MSKQHFMELFWIVTWSSAAMTLGGTLLFFLALRWFPRFADAIRRVTVWQLNHAPLPKGSLIQQSAFRFAERLAVSESNSRTGKRSTGKPSEYEKKQPMDEEYPLPRLFKSFHIDGRLARNRCYETVLATIPKHTVNGRGSVVIKRPLNRMGRHLLSKEAALLDYLREQVGNSVYAEYLPREMERINLSWRRQANLFVQDINDVTARQLHIRFAQGLEGEHLGWMFNRLLEALGFIHRQGTVHGAILPQHLLFGVDTHGLQIVDWTHARKIGRPFTWLPQKDRHWFPDEALYGRPAVPASDIYMAAKNLIYLAGGGEGSNQVPQHIPVPMRRFIKACLLDSPNMRPDDAWELHEEFREILEDLYGPPKFHQLQI